MESKQKTENPELINTENRLVVARGGGKEVGKKGEGSQKIQTCSYQINPGDVMYGIVINTMSYI